MHDNEEPNSVIIAYGIVSPLQLVNFLTYLETIGNKSYEAYIFLVKYWKVSIIPKRYLNYCKNKGIVILDETEDRSEIISNILSKEVKATFVFVKAPSMQIMKMTFFNKKIEEIVVIDEGLSSYAGYLHSLKASYNEKGILRAIKYCFAVIITKILSCIISQNIFYFSAFKDGNENINIDYKNNFVKTLQHISSSEESFSNSDSDSIYKNCLLFCSQPWVDLNYMTEKEYYNFLKNLESNSQLMGLKLLIKKHPADVKFDYKDFQVLEFDGIIEEMFATKKFNSILSKNSTSSILVPACFNSKSFLLNFDDIKEFDHNLQKLFRRYCLDFSKNKYI